jgi:RND superfamily putative drug exporter
MVWVWQTGHGSHAIWGVSATGSIIGFIPLMTFAFLFGISMDYEVFIMSRIREEYDSGATTSEAVIAGVGRTGRLITSAGLIMFLAFVALATTPDITVQMFATGLAVGILIDATIVWALLMPALIVIFGKFNWWIPGPLARLVGVRERPRIG